MKRLLLGLYISFASLYAFADSVDSDAVTDPLKDNSIMKIALENHSQTEILVPIAFFLFIFGVVFAVHYWRFRHNRELQQSIRLMVEKGVQIPPELLLPRRRWATQSDLRRGIVLTCLGVVLPIAAYVSHPERHEWVWMLIPLAIGVGYLISAKVDRKANG